MDRPIEVHSDRAKTSTLPGVDLGIALPYESKAFYCIISVYIILYYVILCYILV